jgi:peptidoglycan/xylan/chitin deacetylase (PgdA/CDA1 family)
LLASQVVFSVPTHSKVVALTIDDAPHPAVTPKILEVLHALGVKATFFVIGSQAEQWPQLLLDITIQVDPSSLQRHVYNAVLCRSPLSS